MVIYDISQEVFSSVVYEGDPSPECEKICQIEKGDLYNLTAFKMCAHNGTHTDAPSHFLKDGKAVDETDIEKYIGPCFVVEADGEITEKIAEEILKKASEEARKRILIKGNSVVSLECAKLFVKKGVFLVGVESQSVGPIDAPMAVHIELLKNETVLLEGIRLENVEEGEYFLFAAPLNLGGADGAPCRAVLIKEKEC